MRLASWHAASADTVADQRVHSSASAAANSDSTRPAFRLAREPDRNVAAVLAPAGMRRHRRLPSCGPIAAVRQSPTEPASDALRRRDPLCTESDAVVERLEPRAAESRCVATKSSRSLSRRPI